MFIILRYLQPVLELNYNQGTVTVPTVWLYRSNGKSQHFTVLYRIPNQVPAVLPRYSHHYNITETIHEQKLDVTALGCALTWDGFGHYHPPYQRKTYLLKYEASRFQLHVRTVQIWETKRWSP